MINQSEKHGEKDMTAKRYPILLITVLLFSYAAPTLSVNPEDNRTSNYSRSAVCSGDVCISEVLVNAFDRRPVLWDQMIGP